MRKFLLIIFALCLILPAFSLEEVVLNESEDSDSLTLYEKIQNIKSKEITDLTQPNYLLEDVLNYKFKTGIVENVEVVTDLRSQFDTNFLDDKTNFNYGYNVIQTGVVGKFKNSQTYYDARVRFNRTHDVSFMRYLPTNLFIANKSIPHHTIIVGASRTPVGHEGGMMTQTVPFVSRSQIARNFGNIRKIGIRVKGNYEFIDYDIGGYSSDNYYRKFFPGGEFTGMVNIKPLGNKQGKFGKAVIGGGISSGHNDIDYFVSSAHAGWEYKNFNADFEFANASGYNGYRGISNKRAKGLNATLAYKITPKLQVLARYDEFVPDKTDNIKNREYTAGINWFIKGQGLKLMLNYIFCQNDSIKDSHRVVLGMQILL